AQTLFERPRALPRRDRRVGTGPLGGSVERRDDGGSGRGWPAGHRRDELGRNTRYHVDAAHPLLLYYGDLTATGRVDMVEAQYDDRLRGVAPLAPLGRLLTALPAVRFRTRTYAAYANTTLPEVLGGTLQAAKRLEAATRDHEVFLNRGGKFAAAPLPAEAQYAPAFYAGVADFDGDGHEDLFLAQNFFPTEI